MCLRQPSLQPKPLTERLPLLLQEGLAHISEALIGPPLRQRLLNVPDRFGASIGWALVEVHLGPGPQRADLAFQMDQGPGQNELAKALKHDWPGWTDAAAVGRAWVDPTHPLSLATSISFEMDHAGDNPPFPFVSFEHTAAEHPEPARVRLLAQAFEAALNSPIPSTVDRVLNALPTGAVPLHLGDLSVRGHPLHRWVLGVPKQSITPLLTKIGWPGSPFIAQTMAIALGKHNTYVSVHLDIGEQIGPTLGLEWFHPGHPGQDPRWTPLLSLLSTTGLASPEQIAALGSFQQNPAPLLRVVDIKISFPPQTAPTAKAYLAFRRAPGA